MIGHTIAGRDAIPKCPEPDYRAFAVLSAGTASDRGTSLKSRSDVCARFEVCATISTARGSQVTDVLYDGGQVRVGGAEWNECVGESSLVRCRAWFARA